MKKFLVTGDFGNGAEVRFVEESLMNAWRDSNPTAEDKIPFVFSTGNNLPQLLISGCYTPISYKDLPVDLKRPPQKTFEEQIEEMATYDPLAEYKQKINNDNITTGD